MLLLYTFLRRVVSRSSLFVSLGVQSELFIILQPTVKTTGIYHYFPPAKHHVNYSVSYSMHLTSAI